MQRRKKSTLDTSVRPMLDNSAATSAEGLRRFALTYKSTVQGKIDLEKFRTAATSKSMKKPFDPRFRRTRVDHKGDTSGTKSDTKVPSPFHQVKQHPSSSPMVSSMPSSPKRSPRKKSRIPVTNILSKTTIDDGIFKDPSEHDVDVETLVKKFEKERPRRMKSMIERSSTMDFRPLFADAAILADLKAPFPSRESIRKCDEQIGTEKTKYSSGDGHRIFDTYISPPIEIKGTPETTLPKSNLTLPFSAPATEHHQCMCNECICLIKKREMQFSDCTTSMLGTNTIIEALEYSKELRNKEEFTDSLCVMWCLYGFGCLLGLILVSCLAWIVSSDTLWNWVNKQAEPLPESQFFVYSVVANCGAAVVFTVNVVIGTLYKLFMLPRNSVFGSDDEEIDNFW